MPTTRPRHAVTETDPVAAALDAAARRWPDEGGNRGRLLIRLIEEGHRSLAATDDAQQQDRVAAVVGSHGALAGVFGDGYLDKLLEDWPE